MKTTRNMIWDMVYNLVDKPCCERLCLYEGILKWENEVQDIVDAIEDLAIALEKKILEEDNVD